MVLTAENYYSKEANKEYMSVSQYKDFAGTYGKMACEFSAVEKLEERWEQKKTTPLLVGSYVDSYFEGTVGEFKKETPEIFTRDGGLKAPYIQADKIIERMERDPLFMMYMSGKKQVKEGKTVAEEQKAKYEIIYDMGTELYIAKVQLAELKEQDINARIMKNEMQDQLTANIKNRGQLESLPLIALMGEKLEIISGHHRVKSAREAGLKEIIVILDKSGLTRSKAASKQLAHNAISEKLFKGKNNLAICMDAFGIVSSEAGKMKGQVNAITNKYNMNRAQRRQEGKKNKHGKNGAVVTPIGNASGRDNS